MIRTITEKLNGTVVEIIDVDELFGAPALKGRIVLVIRLDQGLLSIGKKVRLSSSNSAEVIDVVGIEMSSVPSDPNLVRVLCSKPKILSLASGKVQGWSIAEE